MRQYKRPEAGPDLYQEPKEKKRERRGMEGQLSLFPEEKKPHVKMRPRKRNFDPSQTYDKRMERFLHYMETKGMHEQWIEMAAGEIRIVIEALADYHDIVSRHIETMEDAYGKAAWEYELERIKQIQTKLEESIRYNRDRQFEICKKRRKPKDDDIGEDAVVLLASRGKRTDTDRQEAAPAGDCATRTKEDCKKG